MHIDLNLSDTEAAALKESYDLLLFRCPTSIPWAVKHTLEWIIDRIADIETKSSDDPEDPRPFDAFDYHDDPVSRRGLSGSSSCVCPPGFDTHRHSCPLSSARYI
jgi:hypothetical protein